MDTRKVSAAVGFTLLMGCAATVVVVIYNSSGRSSYHDSVEESWKKRGLWMKGRQEVVQVQARPPSFVSESQKVRKLSDELQTLFKTNKGATQRVPGDLLILPGKSKEVLKTRSNPGRVDAVTVDSGFVNQATFTTNTNIEKPLSPTKSSLLPPSPPSNDGRKVIVGDRRTDELATSSSKEFGETGIPQVQGVPVPSINSHLEKTLMLEDAYQQEPNNKHRSNILLVQHQAPFQHSRRDPPASASRHSSTSTSPTIYPRPNNYSSRLGAYSVSSSYQENNDRWDNEEDFVLDEYEDGRDQMLMAIPPTRPDNKDPLKAMGNILQLVTDVYRKGKRGLDINGFLRVINETVQRSSTNGILARLNQAYTKHGNWSGAPTSKSDEAVGRNALENSLSAFAFMSFGVFLLNQIHNFLGTPESDNRRRGRKLDLVGEESELDFLFQPPPSQNLTSSTRITNASHFPKEEEIRLEMTDKSNASNYVNNMFRAALNLVNAYTKDQESLECIWYKYCQDLDRTAGEGGLYSIAARINSVGLRLIMQQIPAELTVDLVLRSLLGWDGLPCLKMFSKCQLKGGELHPIPITEEDQRDHISPELSPMQ